MRLALVPIVLLIWTNSQINAGSATQGNFDFYGHSVSIPYEYSYTSIEFNNLNQSTISEFMRRYRDHNLTETAQKIKMQQKLFELDDVGVVIMIDKMLNGLMSKEAVNQKNFVKYLILKELDYDVLLTRTGDQLNCLGNLSFVPGRYLFIKYNNKVYKDLDFKKRINGGKHLIFIDQYKTYRTIQRDVLHTPKINAKMLHKDITIPPWGCRVCDNS